MRIGEREVSKKLEELYIEVQNLLGDKNIIVEIDDRKLPRGIWIHIGK